MNDEEKYQLRITKFLRRYRYGDEQLRGNEVQPQQRDSEVTRSTEKRVRFKTTLCSYRVYQRDSSIMSMSPPPPPPPPGPRPGPSSSTTAASAASLASTSTNPSNVETNKKKRTGSELTPKLPLPYGLTKCVKLEPSDTAATSVAESAAATTERAAATGDIAPAVVPRASASSAPTVPPVVAGRGNELSHLHRVRHQIGKFGSFLVCAACRHCRTNLEERVLLRQHKPWKAPNRQPFPNELGLDDRLLESPDSWDKLPFDERQKVIEDSYLYDEFLNNHPTVWPYLMTDERLFAQCCLHLQQHLLEDHRDDYFKRFVFGRPTHEAAKAAQERWYRLLDEHVRARQRARQQCQECQFAFERGARRANADPCPSGCPCACHFSSSQFTKDTTDGYTACCSNLQGARESLLEDEGEEEDPIVRTTPRGNVAKTREAPAQPKNDGDDDDVPVIWLDT